MKETRFMIVATAGTVEHVIYDDLTEKEAVKICEGYDWVFDYNGGLLWDLSIEIDFDNSFEEESA